MKDVPCFFCTLTADKVVAANDLAIALLDGFPVSPGHTLVVTKRHVATWFDASPDEQRAVLALVDQVKQQLDRQYAPAGYNVGFNAGEAAGQTVMHLHVHVIPRYRGDVDDPRGGVRGVIPSKQKYGSAASEPQAFAAQRDTRKAGSSPFDALPTFVPGEQHHFVDALRQALQLADRADLLAAFVQTTGLQLLGNDIEDALRRGAHIRILTGDSLGITSADALRDLARLATDFENCQANFYSTGSGVFHPKSYIFTRNGHGVAYVGSSNLSGSALKHGVEWNLRLISDDDTVTFQALCARFEQLWQSPNTQALTPAVIASYEQRSPVPVAPRPEPRGAVPEPHSVQLEALAALKHTRADEHRRGLVVMATGLGKTYLSAFDFKAMGGERALFIAHREEILDQSRAAWASVHPDKTTGTLGVGRTDTDAQLLFASVQTLSRTRHLARFTEEHFDYIIVDEFHHAAAATYRKVLAHFKPRFLLGLTATPDRMDGAPLLALCNDNLVFRCNLLAGISKKLLVPFKYFGVKDEIDFEPIPWRSGRFDNDALTKAVATQSRAQQALREYRAHAASGQLRTLAFCCSTVHADFMADFFDQHGVAAAAVHSGPTSAPRAESLRQFKAGKLEVLCAVDVFNEGLDIPEINTVLMLRPTLSPVIFLQQLGRGLRTAQGKQHLTVVDFIGNHRSFLQKPQGLLYLTGEDVAPAVALRKIQDHQLQLPEGCSVEIETAAIDMLARLARMNSQDHLLYTYSTLRDAHGHRPSASELFAAGVNFRKLRQLFGCWFSFVAEQGDLDDDEARVLERHRAWFGDLLTTSMVKSYKMLALAALIDDDALFVGHDVARNAELAHQRASENVLLFRELREDKNRHPFGLAAVRAWREMPLEVWVDAKSTQQSWFELRDERFVPKYDVLDQDRELFEAMTDELVQLRLREHIDGLLEKQPLDVDMAPAVLVVSHSSGKPILRFDRSRRPDLPEGDVPVVVDGETYLFRFVKIAVNVATEEGSDSNVLPLLMRRWFGPNAGAPGSHHRVQLWRIDQRWQLGKLEAEAKPDQGGEVLVFPQVPFYPELKVACGAFALNDRLAEAENKLSVKAERELSPTKHFVVRADGDSMDGGDRPIKNGDLVLCEWWTGSHVDETNGKPFLLIGHETADTSFAAMKIPVKNGATWLLRSTNPAYPDQRVPAGGRIEPVARVLEVVEEATGLTLWGSYDRDAIAKAFGSKNDQSWQVGHRDIDVLDQHHTVLLVTLRKGADTKLEHRYADRFLSRDEFQWQSQASTTTDSAKGRRITGHQDEQRSIHLFVRYQKREDYLYCGRVHYLRHEGEQPMTVWTQLERPLPESLWRAWGQV